MGASVARLVVGERALHAALAAEVAQLYLQGQSHAGIAAALGLTRAQVHKLLSLSSVLRLCRALSVTPATLLPVELCPPRRHRLDHVGAGA